MEAQEALRSFDAAEAVSFDRDACAAGRWHSYMLLGRLREAWGESEGIAARGSPDPHRFWDGCSLDGQDIILRCLHGLGDTLQFIRYAPALARLARSLTVETQPALKELIAFSLQGSTVITWGEEEPPWTAQVEVMELPRIFRTELETIPQAVPYLSAPHWCDREQLFATRELKVGLFWQSSDYDPARSISVEEISTLLDIKGVKFYNFQAGESREALDAGMPRMWQEDRSILETASQLLRLDLLITGDSMIAHLAGALGVPVWLVLPFRCDWRWMLHRSDTPWYPEMKLFRQPALGNWEPPLRSVKAALIFAAADLTAHQSNERSDLRSPFTRDSEVNEVE